MKKLSKRQSEVLEAMAEGKQVIVFFPPTQSAWIYLDPLKDRVRLNIATFNSLTIGGYIRHTNTVGADYFYEITDAGKVAVFRI